MGSGMAVSGKSGARSKTVTATGQGDDYWRTRTELQKSGRHLSRQTIYRDWCKACGLCIAFCPRQVYERDEAGKPLVVRPDDCIGCRFCETHCPDLAITIEERFPERRRRNNGV
jgi:2-oxoglutarate ferredoxin oxidoreductase subunit delta